MGSWRSGARVVCQMLEPQLRPAVPDSVAQYSSSAATLNLIWRLEAARYLLTLIPPAATMALFLPGPQVPQVLQAPEYCYVEEIHLRQPTSLAVAVRCGRCPAE